VQILGIDLGFGFTKATDAGAIGDRQTLQQKIGIVDVGFQTSDLTVSDRGTFLERASVSTETGVGRAFATIAGKVREKSGVNVELYRLYEAMDEGRIKVRGESFDLSRLIEHVMGQLATDIATDANRLWADEWDMDGIVITGGGGAVLAPYGPAAARPRAAGGRLARRPAQQRARLLEARRAELGRPGADPRGRARARPGGRRQRRGARPGPALLIRGALPPPGGRGADRPSGKP
jgi:hypothetical protein